MPDAGDSPEQLVLLRAEGQQLHRAMAELPARERMLVEQHYFHGVRFDHIAAKLGISKSWASRLHTRALGKLQRSMKSAAPVRAMLRRIEAEADGRRCRTGADPATWSEAA